MSKASRKVIPLLRLPTDHVIKVGQLYHTTWAPKNGMVFMVKAVDEKFRTVTLMTPKTKRTVPYPTKWSDLRFTRAQQHRSPDYIKPTTE